MIKLIVILLLLLPPTIGKADPCRLRDGSIRAYDIKVSNGREISIMRAIDCHCSLPKVAGEICVQPHEYR